MTSSVPTIGGTVRLRAVPQAPLDPAEAQQLRIVVEQFLEALRLRALPGTLRDVHAFEQAADGSIEACFDVLDVELGVFRVLYGLLSHFSLIVAPLRSVTAQRESPVLPALGELLGTDAPLPKLHAQPPFPVRISIRPGAAPPLVVEVVFGKALSDEEKDRLDREIRVWAALVQGGYPRPGDPPGSSALGPFTVRHDDAETLHLSAEAFFAGEECFESLAALLLHWSASIPVVSLETE